MNTFTTKKTSSIFNKTSLAVLLASTVAISGTVSANSSTNQSGQSVELISEGKLVSDVHVDISNLPNLSANESQRVDIDAIVKKIAQNKPLSHKEQQHVLADIKHILLMEGISIDKLDHLRLKPISESELQQLQQRYADKYHIRIKKLAESMRASSTLEKAQELLSVFYNQGVNYRPTQVEQDIAKDSKR